MSKSAVKDSGNKFQRFRARRAAQGMKLLRVWVPDPAARGFAAEAKRQAARLHGAPEENEVLRFIEKSANFNGWTG